MADNDRVRVLRVLEYVGTRRFVEASLAQRAVKGIKVVDHGCCIREAIVGQELGFETVLNDEPDDFRLSGEHDGRK